MQSDMEAQVMLLRESTPAAELAALFAFSAIKNSDKVGLMLFSDKIELFVPPKKGKKHVLRLIRELVAFEPQSAGTDIGLCLETMSKVIKRQGILILISDFLAPVSSFSKPFKLSAKKFDLIPVIVQDKLETRLPPLHACIDVTDPETGQEDFLCLSSGEINDELDDYVRTQDLNLRALFNPYKIEPIRVDTALPPADPVIAFFKARAKKIRR